MALSDSEWKQAALPEVIDFKEGPGILARDFREAGIPLVRLAGLSDNSLLAGSPPSLLTRHSEKQDGQRREGWPALSLTARRAMRGRPWLASSQARMSLA